MATGIKDKVAVLGMGCSRFGERWDADSGDLMAEAFGARGLRVTRADQIAAAIAEGLAVDRPTLIHVPVARSHPTCLLGQ